MPVNIRPSEGEPTSTPAVPRPLAPVAGARQWPTQDAADRALLARGRWFGSLPAGLQSFILDRAIERSYRKGMTVVGEGTEVRGFFALLEGRVHVVRRIGEETEALIHVAEAGFWFGEHGLLSGRPAIASIVAATALRTLMLPAADFRRLLEDEPRHYPHFAALLLERYETVFRYASEARGAAAEEWLWTRLKDLAAMRRRDAQVQGPVDITVSQTELATMVGVSRQTLCMLLGRLQERGRIDVGYRKVRVL